MKLSIIKKVMVGLAAMAGLASADQIKTDEYIYEALSDESCNSSSCVSSTNMYSMRLGKFEMVPGGYLRFEDRWQTSVVTMRRLVLRAFGIDQTTTYWSRSSALTLDGTIVDYGHFDPDTKIVSSTFLQDHIHDYIYSGTNDGELLVADLKAFVDSVYQKAHDKGFEGIRIALADWEYNSAIDGHYISVPAVQQQKISDHHDHPTYVVFDDVMFTQGSVSLYASLFTHDGVTKNYSESTAPHAIDFKRGKDKVELTVAVSTKGETNYWELVCQAEGEWRSVSGRRTVKTPDNMSRRIVLPIEANSEELEKCNVGAYANYHVIMYAENTPDTVYTENTVLSFVYEVSLFPTEHGTQGIVVIQGEDPKNYVEMKYNEYVGLVAEPDDGYEFVCWQDREGKCVYEYNLLQVTQDYEISAKFAKPYEITFVDANGNQVYSSRSKVYEGELPELPALDLKDDNDKYHYYVKTTPKLVPVSADAEYLVEMDSVLNDLSLHFNLNYDIGEDVSIELAEPNECLDVEKLSLRVYNDEGYSEGFALFNYKTNEWLAGGDEESGVHLWANKWNRFDAGVTLPKTGDCLNDEYVKSVNYAIQNNEDGKALVNIYINGEYSGRNRLDVTNPDISFNYKFASTAYTVTWIVEGETVETDNDVVYGSKPKYDGETPTKAADDKYTYEFADWKADVEGWTAESVVKSDVKFTAQFKSTEISSSSKEDDKSSSSAKPSSSSSAKEDKSSSSTKPKSSSSSTKPKSSSSKTDAVVAAAAVPQFSLSVAGRNVQIAGARVGSAYAVLDMQGRVLATGRTASASMEIAVPRAGSYMVRVGSQTKRVNVK